MKNQQLILAALLASSAFAVDAPDAEFDIRLDQAAMRAYAASNNIEFDIENTDAEEEASSATGVREIKIAEFDADGLAAAGSYISLSRLVQGTNAPRPEAVTEDKTYHDGTVVTVRTGVNNGATTWDIEGSSESPAVALLLRHSPIEGQGTPQKQGKVFAYISYNADRSATFGTARVTTAYSPDDGSPRWTIGVTFIKAGFRPASQNPLAGSTTAPVVASMSPTSGPVGTVIRIRGINMASVTEARLGSQVIATADITNVSAEEITFAVPAGATLGIKSVDLVSPSGDTYAGAFQVTA